MDLLQCLVVGTLLKFISAYEHLESISFSPPEYKILSISPSYWYGNLSIPEEYTFLDDISISLQLNEFQGMIFYAIDSRYRTIWVELVNDLIEMRYYNFKIDDIDKRLFRLDELCPRLSNKKLNLRFSLRNEEIVVICNGQSKLIDYLKFEYPIPQGNFEKFISDMPLPIPFFTSTNSTSDNFVHIWIGNTPLANSGEYQNKIPLRSNPSFLWGCVKQFIVRGEIFKLAESGTRVGNMVTSNCNSVCTATSCSYNGDCYELWRERFGCDCSLSHFVGNTCNEEYSIKFDGQTNFGFPIYFHLEKLTFSFSPVIYRDSETQKLLSIKFRNSIYLIFYIDPESDLHIRYMAQNNLPDITRKVPVADGQNYTFIITADLHNIYMKVADSKLKSVIAQHTIKHNKYTLIIENVLIGDTHSSTMKWMKNYTGCFSNFMLQSAKRKFLWNESSNYTNLPKCGSSAKTTASSISETPVSNHIQNKKLMGANDPSTSVNQNRVAINNSYMTYIAIGASLFVMLLISVIVVYRCIIRKEKKNHYMDHEKLTMNETQKPLESTRSSYSIPYGPSPYNNCNNKPMTFKPAYKARSMTSTPNARSLISLPVSMTPTLVTPEDEEL